MHRYETEFFQPHHFERFVVPQGITGLWQVEGRALMTPREALDLDVAYVRGWSLRLDLSLLLRTVRRSSSEGSRRDGRTSAAEPMLEPVRVAVVGLGYWGPNLVRNLNELANADLVAVCDTNPATLERLGKRYPGVRRDDEHRGDHRRRARSRPS